MKYKDKHYSFTITSMEIAVAKLKDKWMGKNKTFFRTLERQFKEDMKALERDLKKQLRG
jgi:hypothetical protein